MLLTLLTLAAIDLPPRPMKVEIIRDAITDRVGATASLSDGRNRLEVGCEPDDSRRVRVTLNSGRWLARGNFFTRARALTYRFDAEEPQRMMWEVEDRAATLDGRTRVAPFLQNLMVADRLVVRARDIEDNRFDMIFRLEGVRPAVEQVLAACGDTRLSGYVLGAP